MKMMAQIFDKEVQDFENNQAPVINCMETVKSREECLKEIHRLNLSLNDEMSEENQSLQLDQIETKLKDLRALSIRCVELVVLWRDQFRYLALIGSK